MPCRHTTDLKHLGLIVEHYHCFLLLPHKTSISNTQAWPCQRHSATEIVISMSGRPVSPYTPVGPKALALSASASGTEMEDNAVRDIEKEQDAREDTPSKCCIDLQQKVRALKVHLDKIICMMDEAETIANTDEMSQRTPSRGTSLLENLKWLLHLSLLYCERKTLHQVETKVRRRMRRRVWLMAQGMVLDTGRAIL